MDLRRIALPVIGLCAFSTLLPAQVPVQFNPTPTRSVGHAKLALVSGAPNLVEGRELYSPNGIAVDTSVTPNILYVADTNNNRVLAWRNSRAANGSRADVVVGQRDFFATGQGGPGTGNTIGLRVPTGLAVDSRGNLYIVDSGNNRVLRFPRPTDQSQDSIQPDLVIGQTSFSVNVANQGNASPRANSVFFSGSGTSFTAALAFDSAGNLWLTDAGNSRVLRYPAAALNAGALNGPDADVVIGQNDFTSRRNTDWGQGNARLNKGAMLNPGGIGFDEGGRLLVTDLANRLLVYAPPFRNGMDAARLAGISVNVQGQPARPPVNEYTLNGPDTVFTAGGSIFVVDSGANRIVRYDAFDTWPAETEVLPSPPAKATIGQPDFNSSSANRGGREPSEAAVANPSGAVIAGGELFLSDTANNRVIVLPVNGNNIGGATRVQGQINFAYRSPNLVEGKEMFLFGGGTNLPITGGTVYLGGGVVIDSTSNPPRMYVADTFNNRVLGYADARRVKPGDSADLILGQASAFESKVNSPANNPDQITDSGFFGPTGVAIDSKGDVYVADSGNGRVLRFAKPFDQPQKFGQRANLVLGQSGFNIKITDATQRNMSRPYGLAFSVEDDLLVSDLSHNRVLFFRHPAGGDFTNGQNATSVFGQRDFISSAPSTDDNRFNTPMHIATDTDNRLYVCDPGNRRIAIFDRVLSAPSNPSPAISLNLVSSTNDRLGTVQGISVSPRTGEIWVADTSNSRLLRYPKFDDLALRPLANYQISNQSYFQLAVAIDAFDNLLVADSTNRVAFHYPGLAVLNAAHYLPRRISPGMVTALYPFGIRFGEETAVAPGAPLPRSLADVEIIINDSLTAPLYFVSPGQINFYVPMSLQPGTTADFVVQRRSTGQVLASGVVDIGVATPAFFTTTQDGRGQIAAFNEDGTLNTNTNGIERGKYIQMYGTGQGFVPNAPPDGEVVTAAVETPDRPRVIIGSGFVADSDIQYSGLAPGLVGVWQLNVRVPMSVPPGSATEVVVLMRSIPSNQAESGGGVIRTTIAVR